MAYADDLAYVHHTGFADLARGASPFLVQLLDKRGIRHGTVADLGCGSGIVLRALTAAGHAAIGVDMSRPMLALARKSAPGAALVHASLYDAAVFAGFRARGLVVDAVFCVGEPLNYGAPTPALHRALFRRVYQALEPGGVFVFDVIVDAPGPSLTRRGFTCGKDFAVLVDTVEDKKRTKLTRDITTFVKRGSRYQRTHEIHDVTVLRTPAVLRTLRAIGFAVTTSTSYGAHPLATRRCAFVCTKRS